MKPKCKLTGVDGNVYAILTKVAKTLERAGQKEKVMEFLTKAKSGDYDHALQVVNEYVDVE